MNKVYMGKYFSALKDVMDNNNPHSKLHKVWNMDETGMVLEH